MELNKVHIVASAKSMSCSGAEKCKEAFIRNVLRLEYTAIGVWSESGFSGLWDLQDKGKKILGAFPRRRFLSFVEGRKSE